MDSMSSLQLDEAAREKLLLQHSRPATKVSVEEVKKVHPMSLRLEAIACGVWFLIPGN